MRSRYTTFISQITLCCSLIFLPCCNSGNDALSGKVSPQRLTSTGVPGRTAPAPPFVERTEELEGRITDARYASEKGQLTRLSELLASLLDDAPEDLEVQALVAQAHWLKGRYDRAHEWAGGVAKGLTPYVKANGDDSRARMVLGRARMVLGDIIGAEVQFRVAVRQGVRDPAALALWANLILKRDNAEAHEALIDAAFTDHPDGNSAILCASHGQLLLALDRLTMADLLLTKCAAQSKSSPADERLRSRITTVRGLVKIRQGQLIDARAFFQRALDTNSDDIDARHNLALILFRTGQADEALELLRNADPYPNPEFYYLLATIQEFTGDTAGAVDSLSISLEHLELWAQEISTRWKVPFFLGRLLARKGQYGRAQQVLEQSLNLEPGPEGHNEIFRYLVWVRQKSAKPRTR